MGASLQSSVISTSLNLSSAEVTDDLSSNGASLPKLLCRFWWEPNTHSSRGVAIIFGNVAANGAYVDSLHVFLHVPVALMTWHGMSAKQGRGRGGSREKEGEVCFLTHS